MSFTLKIKLEVNRKFFYNFRIGLGTMRQQRNNDLLTHTLQIARMQQLCGEIETSLYNSSKLLERR